MNICGCYGVPTDEAMVNVDADTVFVSIVIDAIILNPAGV
jgi:hypothetical protein